MGDLHRTKFMNWLKAILALDHLKKGILRPVVEAMKQFHKDLSHTCNKCKRAGTECVCRPPQNCILRWLAFNHQLQLRGIKWDKVKNNNWKNYWAVANCYNSEGSSTSTGPESTDCAGIIAIIINAKNVRTALGIVVTIDGHDTLSKARNARNNMVHLGECKLPYQDIDNFFDKMIDVVKLSKDFDQDAIKSLKKLQESQLIISEIPMALFMNEVVSSMQEKVARQFQEGVENLLTGMTECINPKEEKKKAMQNIESIGSKKLNIDQFFKSAKQAGIDNFFRKFNGQLILSTSVYRKDAFCGGTIAIRGCTYLHDGRLVLGSCVGPRLFEFDTECKYVWRHDINTAPFNICTSEAENVVHVIGRDGQNCYIVSYAMVDDQCKEQNKFNVIRNADCIAVTGDTFIVGYDSRILIYNKFGAHINDISTDGGVIMDVCVSSVNRNIFYHSEDNKVVCCSIKSGEELFGYSDISFGKISSICCNREGFVYVLEDKHHSVHRIPSGFKTTGVEVLGVVVNIKKPSRVCCSRDKEEMFVVTNDEKLDYTHHSTVLFNAYRM